jgi:CheY-like chemotaxis protein
MQHRGGPYGPARLRVLIADPDPVRARRIAASLAAELINSEIETVSSVVDAERRVHAVPCDAVVASLDLGGGLQIIDRLRPLFDGPLLVSACPRGQATEARRRGADDLLFANYPAETLIRRLARFGGALAAQAFNAVGGSRGMVAQPAE